MSNVPAISESEFALFQELIHRESGIFLSAAKRELLVGRLGKRLRALGLTSFRDYYELAVDASGDERSVMLDSICTNETHFFREPQHFELLREAVLPEWRASSASRESEKRVRVWSAACSTGEEPYSIAMFLSDELPRSDGWTIHITASDLSGRALRRAKEGIWPIDKASEIPMRYLKRYMLKGTGSKRGLMKAGATIRSTVTFSRINLVDSSYPVIGSFDLVFCRNVLIYFAPQMRGPVVDRLLDRLSPRGILFMGHAESLNGRTKRVRSLRPTVYTLAEHRYEMPAMPNLRPSPAGA